MPIRKKKLRGKGIQKVTNLGLKQAKLQRGNGMQGGNVFDDIKAWGTQAGRDIKWGAQQADKFLRDNKVISKLADVVDFIPGVNIPGTDIGLAGAIRGTTKITGYGKKMKGGDSRLSRPIPLGTKKGYADSQYKQGGNSVAFALGQTSPYGVVSSSYGRAKF